MDFGTNLTLIWVLVGAAVLLGILVGALILWAIIKSAVLAALREHTRSPRPDAQ